MGPSEYATEALELCWTLVSKRAWTMSKHSAPAECYSEILRPGNEHEPERLACAANMKVQHENILSLEQAIHRNDDARPVWKACFFLNMQPVRVLLEYFRRDKYSVSSPLGRHRLMGLVAIMADNKVAEDVHASLRIASKANSNEKLSDTTIQRKHELSSGDVVLHGLVHATACASLRTRAWLVGVTRTWCQLSDQTL